MKKKCPTSPMKMKINTTRRYHINPVRLAIIQITKDSPAVGKDVVKREIWYTGGNVNSHSHCGKQHRESSKN